MSAPLALAACGGPVLRDEVLAPQADIDRVAYRHPGPSYLTLVTMKNTGSGNGAHTGLIISGTQRVLWDPAGTFGHASIPERNDVHFGISPRIEQYYISYHSRETYYTFLQTVEVPTETADTAMRLALANGPTPKASCTSHTSRVLSQVPGFGSIRRTLFPNNLSDQFAQIPGVTAREYWEDDSDDKSIAAAEIDRALSADQ